MKLILSFIVFIATSCSFPAPAQQPDKTCTEYIGSFTKLWNVPGVSVVVSIDGRIVLSHQDGMSNLETKVPVTDTTVFRVYSTTKVMTGMAIMKLAELGLLNLEDDVRKHVPYFPDKGKVITIRHLLMHTSGIRHYDDGESSFKTQHFESAKDALALFANDSLLFAPGTSFNYSTFGFILLQAVIENVSGKSYEDVMKQYVWEPAGMNHTSLDVVNRPNNLKAQGYRKDARTGAILPSRFDDVSFKYAAGGVLSNAEDLVKMCIALEQGKLLNKKGISQMFTPGNKNNGLGWGVRTGKNNNSGILLASHPGRSNGFESYLFYYPEKKVAVAVVMNQNFISDIRLLMRFTEGIASYYLPVGKKLIAKMQYIPYLPLIEQLRPALLKGNLHEVADIYRAYKTNSLSKNENTEDAMNTIGYELMNMKLNAMALEILKLNAESYLQSSNVHDSLGEVYMIMGNKEQAIRSYTKSLQLNPANQNAIKKIDQLKKL